MPTDNLAQQLSLALGIDSPDFALFAEMDPDSARTFTAMAQSIKHSSSLDAREQALIFLALNATLVHLNGPMVRAYIRAALDAGATQGEIQEVLQLTSVIGVHGTMPGVLILTEEEGGLESLEKHESGPRKARVQQACAAFEEKRGAMTPAWVACAWQVPELVEAYADFSGVPWRTHHLSARMKELVYVAIDLMPQHTHLEGTRVHMKKARINGASEADIRSVIKMITLMGIQTHLLALPILAEELHKRA